MENDLFTRLGIHAQQRSDIPDDCDWGPEGDDDLSPPSDVTPEPDRDAERLDEILSVLDDPFYSPDRNWTLEEMDHYL